MSFVSESRERIRPVLPLAAMVDVLFLLLIFFMTTSVFREQEAMLDVELPTAESAEPGDRVTTRIVITVTEDNRIYLGERVIPINELRTTLRQLAQEFPRETLIIRGDRDANFGLVVTVMDLAKEAGIRNVSVATVKTIEDIAP